MRKVTGNMYEGITHTHNEISGSCLHGCNYCYMKEMMGTGNRELKFNENANKEKLGQGNRIFVGSSIDMFAENIPSEWIWRVLDHLDVYDNHYMLQTKNPVRYFEFIDHPVMSYANLYTTIETNRRYSQMGKTPSPQERAKAMSELADMGCNTGLTIEPIMAFDLEEMKKLILQCRPEEVYVGRNTNRFCPVPEPTPDEVVDLLIWLKHQDLNLIVKQNLVPYVMPTVRVRYAECKKA